MKRHRVTRRAFMKMGVVGIGGVTLASCVTPSPGQIPTPMPTARTTAGPTEDPGGKILYPGKNTKVTNPNVVLKWNPVQNAAGYALEVFHLKPEADGTYSWDLAFSDFVREAVYDVRKNGKDLVLGGYYYWQVTALQGEMSMPGKDAYKLPSGIPVRIDDSDPKQRESIPYPDRNPFPGAMGSDTGRFYLKPQRNYLEKYLSFKSKTSMPIIPLTYLLLDRYSKLRYQPGAVKSTPLDELFAKSIEDMDKVPEELADRLGGETSFLTQDRLKNIVSRYSEVNSDLRLSLFGKEFYDLPSEDMAEKWMDEAVQSMFSGTLVETITEAAKTVNIDLKLIAGTHSLKDPIRLKVVDQDLNRNEKFLDEKNQFLLSLLSVSDDKVAEAVLTPRKEGDGNYLVSDTPLPFLDSAGFMATLIGDALPNGTLIGTAYITGGQPVLLSVDPVSALENEPEIRFKVRDGGAGAGIILKPASGTGSDYSIPILSSGLVGQTRDYQTYRISLAGQSVPVGAYSLRYTNSAGAVSANALDFFIRATPYIVRLKRLICIDESNPEWWGDDSISFTTLVNTNNFLQKPASSRVYGGFSDDAFMVWSELTHGDGEIYYRNIPDADPAVICGRPIETYLSISVGIYEHDDLAWLAWLINHVIDIVQSFIEGLINIYTGGVGGYLVEFALEASGLNDMREQAINSLVSGWEVELLHEGTWTYPSVNSILDMNGPESQYQLDFGVYEAQACPAG